MSQISAPRPNDLTPRPSIAPPTLLEELRTGMDRCAFQVTSGDVMGGMQSVIDFLRVMRAKIGPTGWREWAVQEVDSHPIAALMFQCPLTRRSKDKPRGYPGDAVMLDHIYGLGVAKCAPHPATFTGELYFHGTHSHACRAVRNRREIIAKTIDAAAELAGERKAEIVSIACGHLRELDLSESMRNGCIGRFVGLDQDPESLLEVDASYGALGVRTVTGSVRDIIRKRFQYDGADLVYAAGLLDYLVGPVANKLAEKMLSFLRPGGKMLLANFMPSVSDIGYMEAFMDWWLIYRTQEDMRKIAESLPRELVGNVDQFDDTTGAITYIVIERR